MSHSTLTEPECPRASVFLPVRWGPFCLDQRITQLMTMEPNRSFSVGEGRKGTLGRGNSMVKGGGSEYRG